MFSNLEEVIYIYIHLYLVYSYNTYSGVRLNNFRVRMYCFFFSNHASKKTTEALIQNTKKIFFYNLKTRLIYLFS